MNNPINHTTMTNKNDLHILLIGSGGREHALAWKMAQSPRLGRLSIAPGNAGTARIGTNVDLPTNDFFAIAHFVAEQAVDLIVVGPEDPLVAGLADYFRSELVPFRVPVIGPGRAGARLEGSKRFAKAFMLRHNIPTARHRSFTAAEEEIAELYLATLRPPYVLKADGPAAGKGVLIVNSLHEAREGLRRMLRGMFGEASRTVVIEEYLEGIECSVFVLTDGRHYVTLPEAKDYKRVGEGNTGLNTGGMGAVSPVSFANADFMRKVDERIIRPTITGLQAEGIDYCGFIFFGLINVGGDPMVIEYNCRMGDPETEVVMPRLKDDLVELLLSTVEGRLETRPAAVDPRAATAVVLTSGGYPEAYEKGKVITGLDDPRAADCLLFHAGTKAAADGTTLTSGGRVMAVCSLGDTVSDALRCAYRGAEAITFEKKYYRRDIGFDL